MPDENQDDDAVAEKIQAIWERAGKGERSNWQRLAVMLLTAQSRKREEQERDALSVARALLKDLEVLHARATQIRDTLANIDEGRRAREAAQEHPKSDLHAVVEGIGRLLFPEITPVERFARQSRADLDSALAPAVEQAKQAIESLKAQFEALSLTHATKNRGLLFRLKLYESMGMSERDMATIEGTKNKSKIHQGRRRMAHVHFPSEDDDKQP